MRKTLIGRRHLKLGQVAGEHLSVTSLLLGMVTTATIVGNVFVMVAMWVRVGAGWRIRMNVFVMVAMWVRVGAAWRIRMIVVVMVAMWVHVGAAWRIRMNVFVMVAIGVERQLRANVANYLIASLAVADCTQQHPHQFQ